MGMERYWCKCTTLFRFMHSFLKRRVLIRGLDVGRSMRSLSVGGDRGLDTAAYWTRADSLVTKLSSVCVSVQAHRQTWARCCQRALCASSWSWWATTLSTWSSPHAEAGSFSVTASASLTRPVESGSSCSSSWTHRCLLASFRTKSCAKEEEEVTGTQQRLLLLLLTSTVFPPCLHFVFG